MSDTAAIPIYTELFLRQSGAFKTGLESELNAMQAQVNAVLEKFKTPIPITFKVDDAALIAAREKLGTINVSGGGGASAGGNPSPFYGSPSQVAVGEDNLVHGFATNNSERDSRRLGLKLDAAGLDASIQQDEEHKTFIIEQAKARNTALQAQHAASQTLGVRMEAVRTEASVQDELANQAGEDASKLEKTESKSRLSYFQRRLLFAVALEGASRELNALAEENIHRLTDVPGTKQAATDALKDYEAEQNAIPIIGPLVGYLKDPFGTERAGIQDAITGAGLTDEISKAMVQGHERREAQDFKDEQVSGPGGTAAEIARINREYDQLAKQNAEEYKKQADKVEATFTQRRQKAQEDANIDIGAEPNPAAAQVHSDWQARVDAVAKANADLSSIEKDEQTALEKIAKQQGYGPSGLTLADQAAKDEQIRLANASSVQRKEAIEDQSNELQSRAGGQDYLAAKQSLNSNSQIAIQKAIDEKEDDGLVGTLKRKAKSAAEEFDANYSRGTDSVKERTKEIDLQNNGLLKQAEISKVNFEFQKEILAATGNVARQDALRAEQKAEIQKVEESGNRVMSLAQFASGSHYGGRGGENDVTRARAAAGKTAAPDAVGLVNGLSGHFDFKPASQKSAGGAMDFSKLSDDQVEIVAGHGSPAMQKQAHAELVKRGLAAPQSQPPSIINGQPYSPATGLSSYQGGEQGHQSSYHSAQVAMHSYSSPGPSAGALAAFGTAAETLLNGAEKIVEQFSGMQTLVVVGHS